MAAERKEPDDLTGYELSMNIARHYKTTQRTVVNLLKSHPRKWARVKTKHGETKMMYVYHIEGIAEIMEKFCKKFGRENPGEFVSKNIEKKTQMKYEPMPDLELFRKVAQEYRQSTQSFWG
jgi:hypothetical protein